MSEPKPMSGRCLCGAITFTARPETMEMEVCHCGMCRRWTGAGFLGVDCHRADDVEIEGSDHLGVYASSEHGERCFCKTCGTTLFWRTRDGSHISVSAETFDDPSAFTFTREIFIDEKPANYAFANDTEKLTAAEVIAQFQKQQAQADG